MRPGVWRDEDAIAAVGIALAMAAAEDDACGSCGHPYDHHAGPCGACACAEYLDPRDVDLSAAKEVA